MLEFDSEEKKEQAFAASQVLAVAGANYDGSGKWSHFHECHEVLVSCRKVL